MKESTFYLIVYAWIAIAIFIFPVIIRVVVPYGRHATKKWGAMIDNRIGWMLMELPALLVFAGFYLFGSGTHPCVTWVFFSLWVLHYINRTVIFPFRLRTKGKKMPIAIVFMSIGFNFMNGFINGYYLGTLASEAQYPASYFFDPRFFGGLFIFFFGMFVNWQSDNILIHLRKPGETGYIIPQKGFFHFVSCPNHLGEIIEWAGFAFLTWSSPALAFFVWTLVNLMPRALHHHKWYKDTFSDYPPDRKALFPFIL
ncbi:MAG: 3-oxo-5-alpha-steroid 4-dehydrogenase [Bacteroidales bacterium]|nr:3-oxo-5-alpha-steroid 4-dehydrogenase [Bacteroidales bacterium]MDD4603215.1 3-oxo-5-alpha-steroid 4-dehydrogenase [Bacteroidales bacterium]